MPEPHPILTPPVASGKPARPGFQPGLLLLQAQRLEDLAQTVLAWCAQYPPAPLEEEVLLVPSNGMSEWFKAQAAKERGIFSGTRVELPARWAWRLYQSVLGEQAQRAAVFDKTILPWHLAAQWPAWAELPAVRAELETAGLSPTDIAQRESLTLLRWCTHAADLFDQYQLYRADWLQDWSEGRPLLRVQGEGKDFVQPMQPEHLWQAQLWVWLTSHANHRAGMATPELHAHARMSRVEIHQACVAALRQSPPRSLPGLPERVVLLGTTSLPPPILDLLDALSLHAAVVMAVPNPCRVQWIDLAQAPREGNPLLAAWGKQARDFMTMIERLDDRTAHLEHRRMARVERDDELRVATALERLQAAVHLNESLSETAAACRNDGVSLGDGSIRLVTAHTALREVEILHDHLLHHLTTPDTATRVQPHEVIVMVPDLSTHAAAIQAVFGAFPETDPRHIPWGMADQRHQAQRGLLELANWLLSLPVQRCTASELHRLLQTPALCTRWGLDEEDRRQLLEWVNASGIRWGLSPLHRELLGLGAAGGAMTWRSGVDRMLAGYAATESAWMAQGEHMGRPQGSASVGPVPLKDVRGLAARAVGQLAALLQRLEEWLHWSCRPHDPHAWSSAFRALWADLFEPSDPTELRESQTLEAAVTGWLRATQEAGFTGPLDHALVREAVAAQLGQHEIRSRFRSNGVTFCTLMPLRAIPFQIVCLLGMNDGHYPRPATARRGDLLADPALSRPGDRSRRTDDRQLMLDAVLSARRQLLVSWVGHRAHDNKHQPPSVLVGQFCDVLAGVWNRESVQAITTAHPLQPFSPAYFRQGPLPETHVHEWQARCGVPSPAPGVELAGSTVAEATAPPLDSGAILRWLRCPVTAFWEDRVGVRWSAGEDGIEDTEPLAFAGLTEWAAWDEVTRMLETESQPEGSAASGWAQACADRLRRMDLLPLAAPGQWQARHLLRDLEQIHRRHQAALREHPGDPLMVVASRFLGRGSAPGDRGRWRVHLLMEAWWQQATDAALGNPWPFQMLTPDACIRAMPLELESARAAIEQVGRCLTTWMAGPAPMPATLKLVAALHRPASLAPSAMDRVCKANGAWRRSFGPASAWSWHEWASGRPWQEWHEATLALYGPFWQWCGSHLTVQLNADPMGLSAP